ncbi:MAG: ice-binding family protein [Kiritimatiellae bacterium]|jgi:hypothetical protein|nr:ice-binding family protein [Kiritimatiellia bacterium]
MKTFTITVANTTITYPSPAQDAQSLRVNRMKRLCMGFAFAVVAVMIPHRIWASVPVVDNANGASNVLSVSATLCGTLTSTGALPTQVSVYWGETDGGTNTIGSWGHTNDLGTKTEGPLSLEVSNLVPDRMYYYRFYATNLDGWAWANPTANFQTLAAAGPMAINLRSTAHFTILAGAAVITMGEGVINGDVGASPISGSSILIPPSQVNGTIYAVDATGTQAPNVVIDPVLLTAAKGDLTLAYNEAAGRTPVPTGPFLNPGAGNLAGLNLIPGLYKFTSGALITGDDVTLTGGPNDVWIFQIASDLTVGSMVHVILAGGAQARNIFWQVGTSATIGTFAVFKGTILAYQSITMDTSSTMDGRALAFEAGVTFNGDGGSLPTPAVPEFTAIFRTNSVSATVVLETTPYYFLTLQFCPDLLLADWMTVATDTPVASPWTYTDTNATTTVTQRFYRAFLTQ